MKEHLDIDLLNLVQEHGSEQNFAQRLQEEMAKQGLSQAKLAKRLGDLGWPLHQSAISKILNPAEGHARRSVSIDEAMAFSRALDVPLPALLVPTFMSEVGELSNMIGTAFGHYKDSLTEWKRFDEMAKSIAELAKRDPASRSIVEKSMWATDLQAESDPSVETKFMRDFFKEIGRRLSGDADGE